MSAQFRQGHVAHGRRGGQRGAADGAEAGAGADRRHAQATLPVTDEGGGAAEDRPRQAAFIWKVPYRHVGDRRVRRLRRDLRLVAGHRCDDGPGGASAAAPPGLLRQPGHGRAGSGRHAGHHDSALGAAGDLRDPDAGIHRQAVHGRSAARRDRDDRLHARRAAARDPHSRTSGRPVRARPGPSASRPSCRWRRCWACSSSSSSASTAAGPTRPRRRPSAPRWGWPNRRRCRRSQP